MEGLIVGNRENTPHLHALLKRLTAYGYLSYYPVDKILEGVEDVQTSSILFFTTDFMDWGLFVHHLEALHAEETDPMPGLFEMCFVFMDDLSARVYSFRSLREKITANGLYNGTP